MTAYKKFLLKMLVSVGIHITRIILNAARSKWNVSRNEVGKKPAGICLLKINNRNTGAKYVQS